MRTLVAIGVLAITFGSLPAHVPAQESTGDRIGDLIDRGLKQARETWNDVRQSLDELGVQGRVYGRLRWDKTLADASIDIDVDDKDVVVLTGVVKDEEAQQKAVELAQDTIGVRDVVDRLRVDTPRETQSEEVESQEPRVGSQR